MVKPLIKVTLGLCAKNSEETVEKTIDSVTNQDFPHDLLEAIFVDDGSDDRTLSILLDNVAKMDIPTVVFSSEWRGLGAARQMAVDKARGEYIIWVDSDIILPKDYVRKQVEFMEQNPQAGVAVGKAECRRENLVPALINLSLSLARKLGTAGSIFRVNCLRQVGGFDKRIKGAYEDADIITRLKSAGWQICTNQEASFRHLSVRTLRDLWNQYLWYGYSGHYLNHKHKKYFYLPFMVPSVTFVGTLKQSLQVYKLRRQKKLFLLPLLSAFRIVAWWFGFVKSHIDGYGHDQDSNKMTLIGAGEHT